MTNDKALEELFLAQKPQFDDKADFMANLNKRLDAVEFIKQHQEANIRHYKIMMAAAFLVGIMSGAVAMFFVLSTPVNVPLFTFGVHASWMLWIADNSRLITAIILALFMSFGIISIINNVMEIILMRSSIKDKSATRISYLYYSYDS